MVEERERNTLDLVSRRGKGKAVLFHPTSTHLTASLRWRTWISYSTKRYISNKSLFLFFYFSRFIVRVINNQSLFHLRHSKKRFSEERTVYDWTNKEKSKSLDKPSYVCAKKEDKDKDKKETVQREIVAVTNEADSELREKKGVKGKSATNEMLESDNPPPEYKSDYMVIDFDIEVRRPTNCHVSSSSMNDSSGILYTSPGLQVDAISERNALTTTVGAQRPHSLDTEDDEGTEMKVIESRRPVQVLSRSNFDTAQTPIDTAIEFPIREQIASKQLEKPKVVSVNGTETSAALPLQTYNSVKCVVSGTLNLTASTPQGKVISSSLYSVMPVSWPPPNIAMGKSKKILRFESVTISCITIAKFEVSSVAEMTGGEYGRFFDADNKSGRRKCLTRRSE